LPDNGLANRLAGVFLPVTTPFDSVTGEIAPVSFRDNLRHWINAGVDGIVLFGSTGEGVLLDDDEKLRLTAWAREVVPPGVPLVVGSGMDSTRATIRVTRQLAEQGAEAALVHPPPYFGAYLPAAALLDHYRAVADASPIPVIVYHMPKYTKVTIDAGLMGEITRHPNVVGLKDSSGDIKRFAEYTEACPKHSRLFVGNGSVLYTALELGAAGGIVAVGVFAPGMSLEVVRRFREGDAQGAGRVQETLAAVHKEIVATWGAVGVKTALDLLGRVGGRPRSPLRALGDKERKQVARALENAQLL
jgi:4-hydroxy-2-oxoglutarate aldolase